MAMWQALQVLLTTILCLSDARSLAARSPDLTYNNPLVYSDFPDNDVFLGPDGAYYFSGSSFHYSPGAPILKSYDLVNWEFLGHSVPTLDFGSQYNMTPSPDYVGGIWASSMRYRPSNQKWYWIGCIGFWVTYVYTAPAVEGPWERAAQFPGGTCYYDCGLLIDDDDTMYVVYGNTNVSIAQLAPDGLSQVKSEHMFDGPPGMEGIEGNRLYKINGTYYVLDDWSSGATLIWKSSNIWGPWDYKVLLKFVQGPLPGGGDMEQGSLVQAPDGQWQFVSFTWNFPSGRIPIMRPLTWDADGWPTVVTAWDLTYPLPAPSPHPLPYNWTASDTFSEAFLRPEWEWNHNPDPTKYSLDPDSGLTLSTATVTTDIYYARNTLTHRTYGPHPGGVVQLDVTDMADGDRAGFAVLRDITHWVEISRTGDVFTLSTVHNATQDQSQNWAVVSNGTVVDIIPLPAQTDSKGRRWIWLRVDMNTMPDSDKQARFSYSVDGKSFTDFGASVTLGDNYLYFLGYRFAIFNFATKGLGGKVVLRTFENWTK